MTSTSNDCSSSVRLPAENCSDSEQTATDEEDDDESEDSPSCEGGLSAQIKQVVATGRGVTLSMLMADGLIHAGNGTMSIEYLGKRFIADLLEDGNIRMEEEREENQLFTSPSAWAIYCKRMINPNKKSGCGWASVRFKGKKLDTYKSSWFRKHRTCITPPKALMKIKAERVDEEETNSQSTSTPATGNADKSNTVTPSQTTPDVVVKTENTLSYYDMDQGPLNLSLKPEKKVEPPQPPKVLSVKHSTLGPSTQDRDFRTLVQCTNFNDVGKIQPFTVSFTSNSLLLLDFHCHLTSSEVNGYLGGKWDPSSQHLSVDTAYPCKCRLADSKSGALVEREIQEKMMEQGVTLVGWYHSHPRCQPDPSLSDISSQLDYQLKMKGPAALDYLPCLGLIVSPYDCYGSEKESAMQAYWVMPPPESRPDDYGMPMNLSFTIVKDMFLSQDIILEMESLMNYYRIFPDLIKFKEIWFRSQSFLNKLKSSLLKKCPNDNSNERLFQYIDNLLVTRS